MDTVNSVLSARTLSAGYDHRTVFNGLDVDIAAGSFTVIIGPNACGKSTLLRSLARLIKPTAGTVLLNGDAIERMGSKELARAMGLLPQSSIAPEGISVGDLVARGRYPHQGVFNRWSPEDDDAVGQALAQTQLTDLVHRNIDELSGGQRQRAWIALTLAQETPVLLLDEPTTFLDMAHQIEVLELCTRLHRQGRTVIAVLHDINQALRYATDVIAMKDGEIVAHGSAKEVGTEDVLYEVFGVRTRIMEDPETGGPLMVPRFMQEAMP